jgi:hypothetical protein
VEPETNSAAKSQDDVETANANHPSTASDTTDPFVSSSDIDESNKETTSKSACDTTSTDDVLDLYVTTHEISEDTEEEGLVKEIKMEHDRSGKFGSPNMRHSNQPWQNNRGGGRGDYRGGHPRQMMPRYSPRGMNFNPENNNFRPRNYHGAGGRPPFRPFGDQMMMPG